MERYGVSRAVLREAVRIVEYLGVARMRQGPGGGLVVAAPNATAVTSAALVYFAYDRVKLEEVLGARRIVEEMAVELAATRATDAQLDHLRSWLAAANGAGHRAGRPVGAARRGGQPHRQPGHRPVRQDHQPDHRRCTARPAGARWRSGARSGRPRWRPTSASSTPSAPATRVRARLAMRDHLEEIEGFLLSRRGRAAGHHRRPEPRLPRHEAGRPDRHAHPGRHRRSGLAGRRAARLGGQADGALRGQPGRHPGGHPPARVPPGRDHPAGPGRRRVRGRPVDRRRGRGHGGAPRLPGHRPPAAVRGALRPRGGHGRPGGDVVRRPAHRAARGDAGGRAGGADRGRRPGQPRLARR